MTRPDRRAASGMAVGGGARGGPWAPFLPKLSPS